MSASNKMVEYLAQRDHTEKELRTKLSKFYSAAEIDEAIQIAKSKKWIPETAEELKQFAEKIANILRRKGKGIRYINNYLKKVGLPNVAVDSDQESEKADELLTLKFQKNFRQTPWNQLAYDKKMQLKGKMLRFLLSKGYNMELAQNAVNRCIHQSLSLATDPNE